jgi:APA family basic amino acid/polyamine antiporter
LVENPSLKILKNPMTEESGFKKEIKLLDGIMLVAGTMIGSGIFIVSADIARNLGSGGWMMVVWALAGLLTMIAALSYRELTGMYPKAGGQYVFLREAYNPLVSFLYGWTVFLVIQTGTIAAVAVAFAKFSGVFVPYFSSENLILSGRFLHISTQQLLAIAVIILLTWVNMRGVKNGKNIQTYLGSTKILALLVLIGMGLFISNQEAVTQNFANMWHAQKVVFNKELLFRGREFLSGWNLLVAICISMVGSMFAMDAWNNITFAGEEVKNAKKTIGLSMVIGTTLVTLIYMLVNVVYLKNLPLEGDPSALGVSGRGIQFAVNDRVAVAAAESMIGNIGVMVITFLIVVSTFSCLNGCILSGARVYFKMADDKLFFKGMNKLNRHGVPAIALIFQAVWASLLCLSGTYGNLLDYVVFAVLLFYIFTIIGIFILRKKHPNAERPNKAFGYPFLPIVYLIATTFICMVLLIYKPDNTWPGVIIVGIGIPAYYVFKKRG